jgi:hypothetical protein
LKEKKKRKTNRKTERKKERRKEIQQTQSRLYFHSTTSCLNSFLLSLEKTEENIRWEKQIWQVGQSVETISVSRSFFMCFHIVVLWLLKNK